MPHKWWQRAEKKAGNYFVGGAVQPDKLGIQRWKKGILGDADIPGPSLARFRESHMGARDLTGIPIINKFCLCDHLARSTVQRQPL
jgi:hypothetical protein